MQLHSEAVPEGIKYPEVEVSGYLEGVKDYEEKVLVKEKDHTHSSSEVK